MKYIKIFSLLLSMVAMCALSSCKNDKDMDFNTASDVYVSMTDTEVTFKENKGLIKVPFTVTGTDRNGYVKLTFKVEEYEDGNPSYEYALPDVHYYVTCLNVNVAPEDNEGNIEIKLVDDNIQNDARRFIITIVKAEGAQIGTNKSTVVIIKDNDDTVYNRLGGYWQCGDRKVFFQSYDEGETNHYGIPGYETFYMIQDMVSLNWEDDQFDGIKCMFYYNADGSDADNYLSISYSNSDSNSPAQRFPDNLELGGYDVLINIFGAVDSAGYIVDSGEVKLQWDDQYTTLTVISSPLKDDNGIYYADFDWIVGLSSGYYSFADYIMDVYQMTRVSE